MSSFPPRSGAWRPDPVASGGQTAFAAAVQNPDLPVPGGIRASRARPDAPNAKRFSVYRNNVTVGLIDALAMRFPASRRIVGDAFFRAAARLFVARHPPSSRIMTTYGDALPDFLRTFPPAARVPYLPDVADLEAALTHAYHAKDAAPVGADVLAAVPPEALGDMRPVLHPAVRLVTSRFPVVTLHERNAAAGTPGAAPDMKAAEDALVTRPRFDVLIHRLPVGGAAFAGALRRGETLGQAAAAGASEPGFDLAANIAGLFAAGAVTALRTPVPDMQHQEDPP